MNSSGTHSAHTDVGSASTGPSGLTPEHKAALAEASEMIANGASQDMAVDHLVSNGMPRVVAKVLVKQYDRTRQTN